MVLVEMAPITTDIIKEATTIVVAATVLITAVAMVLITAVVMEVADLILNLLPTQVGHLVLRDGRIEAMETLQTILNTKVVEVDGEGAFQVKVIHLMSKSKTPFPQVVSLFLVKNLYSILF